MSKLDQNTVQNLAKIIYTEIKTGNVVGAAFPLASENIGMQEIKSCCVNEEESALRISVASVKKAFASYDKFNTHLLLAIYVFHWAP